MLSFLLRAVARPRISRFLGLPPPSSATRPLWATGIPRSGRPTVCLALCPGTSVSCLGPPSSVQSTILGHQRSKGPLVLALVPRLTRLCVAVANSASSMPDCVLLNNLSVSGFRPFRAMAEDTCISGRSCETFSPLSLPPSPSSSLHVYAHYFGHCADDCRGGVGACLFFGSDSQVQEVYCTVDVVFHFPSEPVEKDANA